MFASTNLCCPTSRSVEANDSRRKTILMFVEKLRLVRIELLLVGNVRLSVQRCARRRRLAVVDRLVPVGTGQVVRSIERLAVRRDVRRSSKMSVFRRRIFNLTEAIRNEEKLVAKCLRDVEMLIEKGKEILSTFRDHESRQMRLKNPHQCLTSRISTHRHRSNLLREKEKVLEERSDDSFDRKLRDLSASFSREVSGILPIASDSSARVDRRIVRLRRAVAVSRRSIELKRRVRRSVSVQIGSSPTGRNDRSATQISVERCFDLYLSDRTERRESMDDRPSKITAGER